MSGYGEFPIIRRHHNLLAAQGVPNITGPIQKGNGKGGGKTGGGSGPAAGKGHGKGNGGGGNPAARYWRVLITGNGGGTYTAINELEMYESEFGVNVCSGGSASASSNLVSYDPSEAFDGNLFDTGDSSGSTWAGGPLSTSEWLKYDFGEGVSRSIVAIGMHGRANTYEAQNPTDFEVQYSDDDTNWTTAWAVSGLTWSGYDFKRLVNPSWSEPAYTGSPWGAHDTWRCFIKKNENATSTAVAEFEHRATPSGSDELTGGTASASSTNGALVASNGADNTASSWATNGTNYGWWKYVFGSAVEFAELTIQARGSSFQTQSPGWFVYQYYDATLGTWTTVMSRLGQTWSASEIKTFTDAEYV